MRTSWIKKFRPRIVAVAAALAVAGTLTTAAPAAAAGACGTGYTFYTSRYMYHGSTKVGYIALYTASAGKLCAVALTYGPEVGVPRYRTVQMWDGNEADLDQGVFTEYAGPVYTQTDGSCTSIYAHWGTSSATYSELYLEDFVCWIST